MNGCFAGNAGYLFMLRADLATNPYGLVALLCAFTFLAGYFSLGPFKYGVFLLLMWVATNLLSVKLQMTIYIQRTCCMPEGCCLAGSGRRIFQCSHEPSLY